MLSKEEVLKIIRLARLKFSEDRLEKITKEFNSILDYVTQLEKLNVDGVQAMSHVHGSVNIMREDQVSDSMETALGLQNAPDRSGNFFRVPLVVEVEE